MKFFALLGMFLSYAGLAQAKEPSRFVSLKNQDYQICRSVEEILNQPENKDFHIQPGKGTDFVIPERYKDYRRPEWGPLEEDDLKKHVRDPYYLEDIEFILKANGNSDAQGKPLIQKAKFDFDNNWKLTGYETLLRYHDHASDKGYRCIISADTYHQQGSGALLRYNGSTKNEDCGIFFENSRTLLTTIQYYRGTSYMPNSHSDPDSKPSLLVMEPHMFFTDRVPEDKHLDFHMVPVCEFREISV